ncbi:LuxR C-terminal-related transcriptional regulator [Pseudomonadota bacterium]
MPLSRKRVSGQLLELTENDLRFTQEEAQQFFRESAGLDLDDEDVALLEQRTEGWAAGLQLAALSLQGEDDHQGFINAFAGDDRFITDYLTEEVLRQQSETIREFLLQTSILERLSGPLCDAVTERRDSVELLHQLEQSDMFIIPLDNRRCWYRYHHLFADLLQSQLARLDGDQISALHLRASQWFNDNGFPVEAMHHAFTVKNYNQVIRVMEVYAQPLFLQGRCMLLGQWFEKIPPEYLRNNISLLLKYAWNQYIGYGVVDDVLIEEIEQSIQGDHATASEEEIAAISLDLTLMRAFRALQQLDLNEAIKIGEQLVEEAGCYGSQELAAPYLQLGVAYFVDGQLDKAVDALSKSERDALSSETLLCLNGAVGGRAMSLIRQGKLSDAQSLLHVSLNRLIDNGWDQQLVDTSWLYLGLANIAYEYNDLILTETCLSQAADFAELDRWDTIAAMVDMFRVRIKFVRSEQSKLGQDLVRFDAYKVQPAVLPIMPSPDCERYSLLLMWGEVAKVGEWLAEQHLEVGADIPAGYENEYRLFAKYLLANQRVDEAMAVLNQLQAKADEQGRAGDLIGLLALQTLACHAQGNDDQAQAYLKRALTLAKPQGYVRTFIDLGQPMALLLERLRGSEHGQYVAKLLSQFGNGIKAAPAQIAKLLSKKEHKTLLLLSQGLSNNEIAEQSFVSINTVKTHLKNIYAKLSVENRAQAIEKTKGIWE